MTCIAGYIDNKGKSHIASDSLGSNGHTKGTYKNQKIFKKGNMLIGYTSSYRMGQLLEHYLTLPERKVNQTVDKYIYVDFVNEVRKLFKDYGYMKIRENEESIGQFLIMIEGRIFQMQDDLSILESEDNFDSVGSGANFAVAVMHTLKEAGRTDAKAILEEAINTASKYVATVGGEVRYLKEGE